MTASPFSFLHSYRHGALHKPSIKRPRQALIFGDKPTGGRQKIAELVLASNPASPKYLVGPIACPVPPGADIG